MAKRQTTARSKDVQLVRCMECQHSTLMQWFNNPVIAECDQRHSFGKPMRQVARMTHRCESYERYKGIIKTIKHMQ